jgi:hypothetical protein
MTQDKSKPADAFAAWMRRVDQALENGASNLRVSTIESAFDRRLDALEREGGEKHARNVDDWIEALSKRIDMLEGNQRAVITPAHNKLVARIDALEAKLPDNTLNRRDVGRLVRAARKVRSWWVGEPDTKGGVEILGELKAAIEAFEGDYK